MGHDGIATFSANPVLAPADWRRSNTPTCNSVGSANQSFVRLIDSSTVSHVLSTNGISGVGVAQTYGSGLPSTFPAASVEPTRRRRRWPGGRRSGPDGGDQPGGSFTLIEGDRVLELAEATTLGQLDVECAAFFSDAEPL